MGRERGDDARDGLGGIERVQGGEHEVSGLGRRQRRLDGLQIAHFADQDHVRVLAQRRLERLRERERVDADLALIDDAALVADQELDRVLDGHDVAGLVAVDVIDHRRERGALAGAGGAGDQDEPALLRGDLLQHLGQEQLLDGGDLERDDAEHDADGPALLEDIDAKAAQPGNAVGEVELVLRLELLLLVVVHDPERHPRDLLRGKAAGVLEGDQRAVDAEHRRESRLEVDVGRPASQRDLEDLVQFHPATVARAIRRSQ